MKLTSALITAAVAVLVAVHHQPAVAAKPAAMVIYAFGQVQAKDANGVTRPLRKGDRVFSGDTVETQRGRSQIQFTDKGFASLQPNTEYRIDDYNFEGKADGNERSFLSLIKGSVRLVTGIVGRANKQNFRLRTKVATIGIRGTSGKVTHCDSGCGARGPGTSLAGYGGIWDLDSGSFKGPVKSGQAKFCDGGSCFDLAGFDQREDVTGEQELEELAGEKETEPAFTQGELANHDGDLLIPNAAGGDTVLGEQLEFVENLIGADTTSDLDPGLPGQFFGNSDAGNGLTIVTRGGLPIAAIQVNNENAGPFDSDISFLASDIDVLRQAIDAFPDQQVVTAGNQALTRIEQNHAAEVAAMRANPATIAPEDFGLTSDGLLTKGRFVDGFLLDAEVDRVSGLLWKDFRELTGFRSEHFIYGIDPGPIAFMDQGTYTFSGGTFSTAADGSSIGLGVTSGSLVVNFGLGTGTIDMIVNHSPMLFDISGSFQFGALTGAGRKFFSNAGTVIDAEDIGAVPHCCYPVKIDGFFSGVNSATAAPPAAGVAYNILAGKDILGVAGFRLSASGPLPAPTEVVLGYAMNFDDFGQSHINGLAGGDSTAAGAVININPFNSATTSSGDTFNRATSTIAETGSNALLSADWTRFGEPGGTPVNYSVYTPTAVNGVDGAPLGHFHAIYTTAPTPVPVIASMTGIGYFTTRVGGTTWTANFGAGGASFEQATAMTAAFTANFTTGMMDSVSYYGNFPSGNFGLASAAPVPFSGGWNNNLQGSVSGFGGCTSSCAFYGTSAWAFAGPNAEGIIASFQGNTASGDPNVAVSGTTANVPGPY